MLASRLVQFEAELLALGVLHASEIEAVRAEVEEEIAAGVAFAEASPVPLASDLLDNVTSQVAEHVR